MPTKDDYVGGEFDEGSMPIFTRGSQRVYFAHVPKTAGMSIYAIMLDNGFSVSKLELGNDPAANALKERYGDKISNDTQVQYHRQTLQHSTYKTWRRWGPFNQSFAVLRDPAERLLSTIRYQHTFSVDEISAFKDKCIRKVRRSYWRKPYIGDGHFIPQNRFLGPETKIYWFGNDFVGEICSDLRLENENKAALNISQKSELQLAEQQYRWVRKKYAKDYALIRRLGFCIT